MPFQSKAQERWAFATKQPFAKQWAAVTPNSKKLPERKSNFDRLKSSLAKGK